MLAFGAAADRELAAQGHGYLGLLAPVLGWSLAAVAGRFVADVARRRAPCGAPPGFGRLWLAAAGALIVIYTGQELAEGWLASGHPVGLAGVLGEGGWIAPLLAVVAGALVALLLRGAHALQRRRARAHAARRPRLRARGSWPRPTAAPTLRLPVLAAHLAGRAPPGRLGPIQQL